MIRGLLFLAVFNFKNLGGSLHCSIFIMPTRANKSLTKSDWEAQREIIIDLFCRQGKKLENVVKFMEENHRFKAR